MPQSLESARAIVIELRAIAIVLPIFTGFDNAAPKSSVAVSSEALSTPASMPTAPETAGTRLNRQRDTGREPSAFASAEPDASTTEAGASPGTVHTWETGAGKSYLIPALEVPGFRTLLNVFDRIVYANQTENGKKVYSSTFSSTW